MIDKIQNLYLPTVKEEKYSFDLISRLMEDRIVLAGDPVGPESAQILISQLLYLDSKSNSDIYIYINSPGGCVMSGLSVIDVMHYVKSPVHTVVTGMAASMGFMYAIHGHRGKRHALPHANLMLHAVSSGARGTIHDMEISVAHSRKLNDTLTQMIVDRSGLSLSKVKRMMQRDCWLTPDEAVAFGFIDHVYKLDMR